MRGDNGADTFVDKRIRLVSEVVTLFIRNKWQTRIRKRPVVLEDEDTRGFDLTAGDKYENEIVD